MIVDGVSYTSRGVEAMSSVQVGEICRADSKSGGACHNSLEIGISNADPCYIAAVWDSSRNTFNSASSSQYVLTISEFEP